MAMCLADHDGPDDIANEQHQSLFFDLRIAPPAREEEAVADEHLLLDYVSLWPRWSTDDPVGANSTAKAPSLD